MPSPACSSEHPDDYGPIRRRCNRDADHEPPHKYQSVGFPGWVDEWEGER